MASPQAFPLRPGDAMPALGLGSWMLTSRTRDAVERALDLAIA